MSDYTEHEKLELFELMLYAIDGTISDTQFARLEELLSEKPGAVDDYVRFIMIYIALNQSKDTYITPLPSTAAGVHEISRDLVRAIEHDEQTAVESAAEEVSWQAKAREKKIKGVAEAVFEKFRIEERRRAEELVYKQYRAERRRLLVGVVSLVAMLAIVVSAWLCNLKRESPPQPLTTEPVPVTPLVIAAVTKASDARWDRSDTPPAPGTELISGPIRLHTGFLEITFKSNARIILEAPAEVNFVDEYLVRCKLGVLTAYVPESARGFTVDTFSVRVTDLGTEFALLVDKTGVANVHVLDGWVAASFAGAGDDEQQRVRALNTDNAMRFDLQAGKISPIAVDKERFARSWDDVLYKPHTSGAIAFERSMPDSVCINSLESDTTVSLLLEATNVAPPHEVTVGITEPGIYRSFEGLSGTLPTGSMIDSYLIHWDPASSLGTTKTVFGSVTFRRPILGLIVDAQRLTASDKLFGHPSISYPADENDISRRLESSPDAIMNADALILSQDRLTLHVTLRAAAMDQVRILVMAASADER